MASDTTTRKGPAQQTAFAKSAERDGSMAQFRAEQATLARAVEEKTARLRALRLAKEAEELAAAPPPVAKAPATKRATARKTVVKTKA